MITAGRKITRKKIAMLPHYTHQWKLAFKARKRSDVSSEQGSKNPPALKKIVAPTNAPIDRSLSLPSPSLRGFNSQSLGGAAIECERL